MTTQYDEYGTGRLEAADDRDAEHPIASVLPVPAGTVRRQWRYWDGGWRGNQRRTPQCVAYSGIHWLEIMGRPGIPDPWDLQWLYDECQRRDEWPGSDYDGTSVRACQRVLRMQGITREYVWALTLDEFITALLEVGPLQVGMPWYRSMFRVDDEGFVRVEGSRTDLGHAVVADGINVRRGVVRWQNSYGPHWGRDGRFWTSLDDVERLVYRENGEAAFGVLAEGYGGGAA